MSEPKDPKAPLGKPTTPGMKAVRSSAPPADFRLSNPDLVTNAPPWVAQILARFDEAQVAEKEAREQAHRAASRLSSAFLKVEANVELTRQEVLGARSDIVRLERHLDALDRRLTSVEARVAALEAKGSG